MVPMEIVDRTFKVSFAGGVGTAFSLDIDGKQYLITAKHVVEEIQDRDALNIFHDGSWKELPVELVGHSLVDVTVLAPASQLTRKEMRISTAQGGFLMGQDVFFAGFPWGQGGPGVDSPFPTPLIKKAVVSGSEGNGFASAIYLDGHNNVGFSGGPVYLKLPNQKHFVISMIISSFTAEREPVLDAHGRTTPFYVQQNSGILQAYNIANALQVIRDHPIGLEL